MHCMVAQAKHHKHACTVFSNNMQAVCMIAEMGWWGGGVGGSFKARMQPEVGIYTTVEALKGEY